MHNHKPGYSRKYLYQFTDTDTYHCSFLALTPLFCTCILWCKACTFITQLSITFSVHSLIFCTVLHEKCTKIIFVISSMELNHLLRKLAPVILNKFITNQYQYIPLFLDNVSDNLVKDEIFISVTKSNIMSLPHRVGVCSSVHVSAVLCLTQSREWKSDAS